MNALLASELRRLTSRRMWFWTVIALLAIVAIWLVVTIVNSHPSSIDNDVMRTTDLWLRDSRAIELGVAQRNRIVPISVFTYLGLLAFGASAVGAEFRAGTVTTILTWEPRRVRLLLVRFLAIALVGMGTFVVVLGVFVGGWIVGVAANGSSAGTGGEFWGQLLVTLARGVLIAGALTVLSAAVATLGRNTAAALGIWFGYLVGVEGVLQGNVHVVTPWLLVENLIAAFGGEETRMSGYTMEPLAGALVIVLYLVVLGGAALATFARRDVT